jgi:hypothetical protein
VVDFCGSGEFVWAIAALETLKLETVIIVVKTGKKNYNSAVNTSEERLFCSSQLLNQLSVNLDLIKCHYGTINNNSSR